jgi:hypothetical protein
MSPWVGEAVHGILQVPIAVIGGEQVEHQSASSEMIFGISSNPLTMKSRGDFGTTASS